MTYFQRSQANLDFNYLRTHNLLTDVHFDVGGKQIPAHLAVLVAASPVFLNQQVYEVNDIDYDVFLSYIDSIYAGKIIPSDKNEQSIGRALDVLSLHKRYGTMNLEQLQLFLYYLRRDYLYSYKMDNSGITRDLMQQYLDTAMYLNNYNLRYISDDYVNLGVAAIKYQLDLTNYSYDTIVEIINLAKREKYDESQRYKLIKDLVEKGYNNSLYRIVE